MAPTLPRAAWLLFLALLISLPGPAQERNLWAVVVGISQFENLPPNQQLEFADKDAEAFARFLGSPRGRAVPEANIKLLVNQDANLGNVRKYLGAWLRRSAGPNDTVYIFIATHGVVEKQGARGSFLIVHDSDPEDLFSTALHIRDLAEIVNTRLAEVRRIILIVDAARGGKLGEQQRGIHRYLQDVAPKNTELIGLMASRPIEFSQEGPQFCGGHGAFTCFLLKGLNGEADANHDNVVTAEELINYLRKQLPQATDNQQHPFEFGSYESETPLSYPDKPGPK